MRMSKTNRIVPNIMFLSMGELIRPVILSAEGPLRLPHRLSMFLFSRFDAIQWRCEFRLETDEMAGGSVATCAGRDKEPCILHRQQDPG